eukprot:Platyproteum_vivax@DN6503_c0_g1_i2.p1
MLKNSFAFLKLGSRAVSSSTDLPVYNYLMEKVVEDVEAKMGGRPVYLDYQATTPTDPRVLDAMLPFMTYMYGNAHSKSHAYGWETEKYTDNAREKVASLIKCKPKEVIWTSGATESNNLAIKGVAGFYGANKDKKKHIITTQIEHKCVLQSCRIMKDLGFELTYLPVDPQGLIDLENLKSAIRPETMLVSVMHVNNEIGVIQNLEEIGKICRENKVLFHTDAAQALGKVPIDVDKLNIDLMSLSGHKIYGPKGVGALYVRSKPRVRLQPLIDGGGQERGFRSGTLPTPLVVGFGKACEVAEEELEADAEHVQRLADKLTEGIFASLEEVSLNGHPTARYAGNVNLSFAYVEGESLLMSLKKVAVSSGSACTSASLEPSYVLRAIGVDEGLAHTSIRFGIGRFTSEEEIDAVIESVVENVKRLREMSPLYEAAQEIKAGKEVKISWT